MALLKYHVVLIRKRNCILYGMVSIHRVDLYKLWIDYYYISMNTKQLCVPE